MSSRRWRCEYGFNDDADLLHALRRCVCAAVWDTVAGGAGAYVGLAIERRRVLETLLIKYIKSGQAPNLMLNDLEFAYAPVRDSVRDLREYL